MGQIIKDMEETIRIYNKRASIKTRDREKQIIADIYKNLEVELRAWLEKIKKVV